MRAYLSLLLVGCALSLDCTSEDACLATLSTPRCLLAPPGTGAACVLDYGFNTTGRCACGAEPCVPLTVANKTSKKQWLVVGDSISDGYISALSAAAPEYEVVHAPSFASGSNNNDNVHWHALCIEGWLGPDPHRWDVISMNAGAHDYAFPDNEHLSLPSYASLLRASLAIVSRLARADATLIWARITPVPTDPSPACVLIPGRLETSVVAYNDAADAVVAAAPRVVRSCDLHAVITRHCGERYAACDWAQCRGPHFSPAGFAALGDAMASCAR